MSAGGWHRTPEELSAEHAGKSLPEAQAAAAEANPFEALTSRQREVARLLASGYTCAEIATRIGCGIKTVDTHRHNVLGRTGCSNAVKLTHLALAWGEVEVMSC